MKTNLSSKIVLLLVSLFLLSCEKEQEATIVSPSNSEKTKESELEVFMKEFETLKPGGTRADVQELFFPEGGLTPVDATRYVYKKNTLIKVEISFDLIDKEDFHWNNEDKILKISNPYLRRGVFAD